MLCDAELFVELKESEIVATALKPDDPEWCEARAEGGNVIIRIKTERIESLLSACEDYFRTLKAALSALDALKGDDNGNLL